ncbi:MAG: N-acetyltransferase [Pseudomonadota bacterium]
MVSDEFFGNDDQRAVLKRGRAMAELLGSDPRYSYYGRTVGLVTPDDGDIDQLAALAKIQGNSNYAAVPLAETDMVEDALKARGLVPMHYAKWEGASPVLSAARAVLDAFSLPDDLHIAKIDASTSALQMASMAELALSCGVLPPSGEVLRGLLRPAICLIALDADEKVVSCAASCAFAHENHPTLAHQAWWGMLATDPAHRGRHLSLILGAHVVLEMHGNFDFSNFMTGVEPGNAPSEAVCARMGLGPGPHAIIGCADPAALRGGRMTK